MLVRCNRFVAITDGRLTLQQLLDPFQAHLPGLECVESEAQQRRGEDQLLHIEDERDKPAGGQAAIAELAAAKGKQQQKRDGGQPLQ